LAVSGIGLSAERSEKGMKVAVSEGGVAVGWEEVGGRVRTKARAREVVRVRRTAPILERKDKSQHEKRISARGGTRMEEARGRAYAKMLNERPDEEAGLFTFSRDEELLNDLLVKIRDRQLQQQIWNA
jgi:hypothetical protein